MKKIFFLIGAFIILFFTQCQKDLSFEVGNVPIKDTVIIVDDNVKTITSSVNGVVMDEMKMPISGATVTCGGITVTTNNLGVFYFKNVNISKANGSVSVSKPGYFLAERSFMNYSGKSHHLKIMMIPKILSGTVNGASGGNIPVNGGAKIIFPANAFVQANGTPYSGTVSVYATWIDPTSANLNIKVPGDLRGIKKDGSETLLASFGMVGAELFDNAGNKLAIASEKKAQILFPIPASIMSGAPTQIPLWHFDDTKSRWIEEGVAEKIGSEYVGYVDKFSFWNVDISNGLVRIEFVLVDANTNLPVPNQVVFIKDASNPIIGGYGFTNGEGYAEGGVPANRPMILSVETFNGCGSVIFNTNIGPFTQNSTNLDTIRITMANTLLTAFSGQITNCQGTPINDAYLVLTSQSFGTYIIPAGNNGLFHFIAPYCNTLPINYAYQATNLITNDQSLVITGTSTTNNINLGTISACNNVANADVYVSGYEANSSGKGVVKYWKNGIVTNVTDGTADCYSSSMFVTPANDIYIVGNRYNASNVSNAVFWKNGTETYIAGGGSDAFGNDIFVNGTDVYAAFYGVNAFTGISIAKYWKNGTATALSDGTKNAYANAIYVSGNDIYVGGFEKNIAGTSSTAIIWKNGTAISLSNGVYHAQVNKIFVVGADVYAVGQEKNGAGNGRAVIWKNGIATYLTDGNGNDAMANGVYVNGADVYVCGRKSIAGSGEKAQLWKNGIATELSVNNGNGIAHRVFVNNNNIYVTEAGFISGPVRIWKNNIPTQLTTGINFNGVNSVIVK